MENLKAYKNQIKEIEALIAKLENGELSLDELVNLEKLTRELHEKSIILKYKAFESTAKPVTEEVTPEPVVEEPVVKSVKEEEIEEPAPFDFAIFDNEDSEMEVAIEEEVEEKPEPIAEEPEPEVKEEIEEEIPEVIENNNPPKSNGGRSFWEQVNVDENNAGSQFLDSKLESLVGAFGLNEKLRYINELFDGSSEHFGDAIKSLDNQNSIEDARSCVDDLAATHEWDAEEESVVEFMIFVNRRYA